MFEVVKSTVWCILGGKEHTVDKDKTKDRKTHKQTAPERTAVKTW